MGTQFVRVTDPNMLFDLWVDGLLYHNDGELMHCTYRYNGTAEEIETHRQSFISDWKEGTGTSFEESYGYILEE